MPSVRHRSAPDPPRTRSVPGATVDPVLAVAAIEQVVTSPAEQPVVSGSTQDLVVPAKAGDDVDAGEAADDVPPLRSAEHVPLDVPMMSSRQNQAFGPYGEYTANEVAARHGASPAEAAQDADEFDASWPESQPSPYREGWLPA